jgi:hypothetical protein
MLAKLRQATSNNSTSVGIVSVLSGLALPRGPELLGGGDLYVAVHQGPERGQQHRAVRVQEGPSVGCTILIRVPTYSYKHY